MPLLTPRMLAEDVADIYAAAIRDNCAPGATEEEKNMVADLCREFVRERLLTRFGLSAPSQEK